MRNYDKLKMNTDDDELLDEFANYTESMAAAPETTSSPEYILRKVNTYLSMGWEESAGAEIERFEDRTGIDFSELVDGTVSRHLKDPREE